MPSKDRQFTDVQLLGNPAINEVGGSLLYAIEAVNFRCMSTRSAFNKETVFENFVVTNPLKLKYPFRYECRRRRGGP